jgi:hypothetical protein
MIDTDKLRFYEQMLEGATHHFAWELIREIKRLRGLLQEVADDYTDADGITYEIYCEFGEEE